MASDHGSLDAATQACLDAFSTVRFGDEVACLECGSTAVRTKGQTVRGAQQYQCESCGRSFNDFTDTIFDGRRVPFTTLCFIIREMEELPLTQIAAEVAEHYRTVHDFASAVETATFDVETFREELATIPNLLTEGRAEADRRTNIDVDRSTQTRLQAFKDARGQTYDEAINALLDMVDAIDEPATIDATPGPMASIDGPVVEDPVSIRIRKGTRQRLKVWKTALGLTHDEALRRLLDSVDEEVSGY